MCVYNLDDILISLVITKKHIFSVRIYTTSPKVRISLIKKDTVPRLRFAKCTFSGRCGGPLGANPGGILMCARVSELYLPPREAAFILKYRRTPELVTPEIRRGVV